MAFETPLDDETDSNFFADSNMPGFEKAGYLPFWDLEYGVTYYYPQDDGIVGWPVERQSESKSSNRTGANSQAFRFPSGTTLRRLKVGNRSIRVRVIMPGGGAYTDIDVDIHKSARAVCLSRSITN